MRKCLREKCGKEFEPNRPKSKFCSDQCRIYNHRETKSKEQKKEDISLDEKTIERLVEILTGRIDIKSATIKKVEGKPVATFNLEVPEVIDVDSKSNTTKEGEPKWKLKNPVMKVPANLKGIARDTWIAEFKKNNR